MTRMFGVERCRNCGQPIQLIPLIGWAHVDLMDNLVCEAET